MKKLLVSLVVLCFLGVPLTVFAGDPVNVASKGFTEQVILGKIMGPHLFGWDKGQPRSSGTGPD